MKPSSWDKQLGLASPRESAASQSDKTNNPSKNEVRNGVGLDVSHHARISQRGGENIFSCRATLIMSPCGDIRWDEKVDPRSRMALSYRNQRTLGAITADKEIDLEQA
jgi:hypothetical protein